MEYVEGSWLVFRDKYKHWTYHKIYLYRESEAYMERMKEKWLNLIIQSGVSEVRVIVEIVVREPKNKIE